MKILITGNLGYVGSHLTDIFVRRGHEVIGCDLSLFPKAVCDTQTSPSRQIIKDFRLLSAEDLGGVEAIAHLAGISNDPMGELDPGLTQEINGIGTVKLAEIAKTSGVRIFAFASSCSIYGILGDGEPITENDPTNPVSEYASSKLFAETGLASLATGDFHVYLLRNATAYGASSALRTDLVVNDLCAGMYCYGVAQIKSDGSPWRPLIHCRDMARAFKEFIEKDPIEVSGKPVNVGFNSENFQVKTIGELVKNNWKEGEVVLGSNTSSDPRNYKVSFDLLEEIFPDFCAEHPLILGIPDLKLYLQKINYSLEENKSKRYIRLNELKLNLNKLKI